MPDDEFVELPEFTTYYDATLVNWFVVGMLVGSVVLVVGLAVAVWWWADENPVTWEKWD